MQRKLTSIDRLIDFLIFTPWAFVYMGIVSRKNINTFF